VETLTQEIATEEKVIHKKEIEQKLAESKLQEMIQDLTVLAITNNQAVHAVEVIKEKKEQAIQVEHQAQEVIEESTAKKTELDTQI